MLAISEVVSNGGTGQVPTSTVDAQEPNGARSFEMTKTWEVSADATEARDRADQRCPAFHDAVTTVGREIVAALA